LWYILEEDITGYVLELCDTDTIDTDTKSIDTDPVGLRESSRIRVQSVESEFESESSEHNSNPNLRILNS
jgi:hypothetical protein